MSQNSQENTRTRASLLTKLQAVSRMQLYIYIYFFSIRVFFHEHSRFTWQQGKGEAISLTPLYLFHLLNRRVDISRMIAKESSPLHIASTLTRNGNFRSERKSLTTNSPALCNCTENETPV